MQFVIHVLVLGILLCIPGIQGKPLERIVNGDVVDITEVPYQAALRRKTTSAWRHHCGAVVISSKCVLTAAHCVVNFQADPSQLLVVVGTSSRSDGTTYQVDVVYSHQYYSSVSVNNDVGLVVTNSIIEFSERVMPVNLPPSLLRIPSGTEAIVSGFGKTEYEGESSDLRAAIVNIVSQEDCARAYADIGSITSGMICAMANDPPRDACQGDSGGPLVVTNTVIGIVSWGEGCANSSYPGVYTNVSHYNTWIYSYLDKIDQ